MTLSLPTETSLFFTPPRRFMGVLTAASRALASRCLLQFTSAVASSSTTSLTRFSNFSVIKRVRIFLLIDFFFFADLTSCFVVFRPLTLHPTQTPTQTQKECLALVVASTVVVVRVVVVVVDVLPLPFHSFEEPFTSFFHTFSFLEAQVAGMHCMLHDG